MTNSKDFDLFNEAFEVPIPFSLGEGIQTFGESQFHLILITPTSNQSYDLKSKC